MMTPSNLHPKLPTKQEIQTTTTKKQATTTANTRPQQANHHQQTLKCPRCDSPNTKFCYYNNYSLTQPRHFCKTCRRYWTKGGALRNVPIGGGCRKNKKLKASSSSSSRFSGSADSKEYSTGSSVDFGGGFKLFHGLPPAMDFNLGGLSFPRLNNLSPSGGFYNHFGDQIPSSSAGVNVTSSTPSGFSLDLLSAGSSGTGSGSLLGFHNHPNLSSVTNGFSTGAIQEVGGGGGSMIVHTSLASSIESLSSINQDLHWKLQQQRLAMLFGDGGGEDQNKETGSVNGIHIPPPPPQAQKLQPILFQNLEVSSSKPEVSRVGNSRKEGAIGEMATEWFFGNSYGQVAAAATPTNSNSNGNDSAGNWNNGVQASWGALHQYNSLP